MQHHFIDIGSVSSLATLGATVVAIIAALNRQRIYRHLKRLGSSLHKTSRIVSENEKLTENLAASEQRNVEWAAAFENVDSLRLAISEQLDRLTLEIAEIRRSLVSKDDLIGLLHADRDALIAWGRLLVGQLFDDCGGKTPAYPAPSLRSVVAIPGPLPVKSKET